jgi:hypothetical protein
VSRAAVDGTGDQCEQHVRVTCNTDVVLKTAGAFSWIAPNIPTISTTSERPRLLLFVWPRAPVRDRRSRRAGAPLTAHPRTTPRVSFGFAQVRTKDGSPSLKVLIAPPGRGMLDSASEMAPLLRVKDRRLQASLCLALRSADCARH